MRLKAFLAGKVKEAVGSQLPSGAWPVAWATTGFYAPGEVPQIDSATVTQKMLVVSHLLEWFNRLPEDPASTINYVPSRRWLGRETNAENGRTRD